ncbi:hypothetical protein SAMN04489712_1195 [Thermomonospora echinospora]|uniref:Transposase n=1 Tax=Thermomonospora echinospora TaxID=1992 RepID=A0A1H6DM01_9ACTN|nr:hypothetical protein SAMN04489712_1195 [Thermomonospora echinospora]
MALKHYPEEFKADAVALGASPSVVDTLRPGS